MYAVKPWGKVFLVGGTIGSYALGIGMRWRESFVDIVEKRPDPSYERLNSRRSVVSHQAVKLLADLGCTERNLLRIMTPARRWRLCTAQLHTIREGDTYTGCSPAEPVYQCEEGALLRVLRSEFLRFGGTVEWDTVARDAFESGDGSDTWTLRKAFGPGTDAEAVFSFARSAEVNSMLIVDDPERIAVLFDIQTGTSRHHSADLENVFASSVDVVIVVGEGIALHMWHLQDGVVHWRCVTRGRFISGDQCAPELSSLHPLLADMLRTSSDVKRSPVVVPATAPAIIDSAAHVKVGVACDAILPVDAFEWRGDRARIAVEEASSICRSFYGKKFHRGYAPSLMRGLEQDAIVKRSNYVRRDLQDAENFLTVRSMIGTAHENGDGGSGFEPLRVLQPSTAADRIEFPASE